LGANLDNLYYGCCHHSFSNLDLLELKLFKVFNLKYNKDKVINEAKSNQKITSEELFKNTNKTLTLALNNVYPVKFEDKHFELINKLERNIGEFSVFRSSNVLLNLKNKTKEEQNAILNVYERHLKVESDYVTKVIRNAKKFLKYQEDADLYPNLEYLPSSSVNKRQEHQELYGIIKPINDPFWQNYLPPNGWGCQCRTRQTDKAETKIKIPKVKIPNGITGNAVLSQTIFTNNHNSYKPFKVDVDNRVFQSKVKKEFEQLKLKTPFKNKPDYKAKNGNTIYVHTFCDFSDLNSNYKVAKLLVNKIENLHIKIRPHANNVKTNIGDKKTSNPEYLINGVYADLKELNSYNVNNRFSSAKKQGCKIVVFKILNKKTEITDVLNSIKGKIKQRKSKVFDRIFIVKGDTVVDFKPKRVE